MIHQVNQSHCVSPTKPIPVYKIKKEGNTPSPPLLFCPLSCPCIPQRPTYYQNYLSCVKPSRFPVFAVHLVHAECYKRKRRNTGPLVSFQHKLSKRHGWCCHGRRKSNVHVWRWRTNGNASWAFFVFAAACAGQCRNPSAILYSSIRDCGSSPFYWDAWVFLGMSNNAQSVTLTCGSARDVRAHARRWVTRRGCGHLGTVNLLSPCLLFKLLAKQITP